MMSGLDALYFFSLAAVAGYVLMSRTPSILHAPLLAGSTLVHGVVLVGSMIALAHAEGWLQLVLSMLGVCFAAANATGAYILSERLIDLFEQQRGNEVTRKVKDAESTVAANRQGSE